MRMLSLVFGLLLVAAALAAVSRTFAGSAGTPGTVELSRVSANGPAISLPAGDRRTKNLVEGGFQQVERLAVHGERAFYRLTLSSGKACYGSGRAGAEWPLDVIKCSTGEPEFPSPERPILDESLVELSGATPQAHFVHIEGFAADGVAEMVVRDASGETVARLPVHNNVYWADVAPLAGVSLVALDANGQVVANR